MSSILDALEKSERERNQHSVPHYQNMQPPEEKTFRWKWLLVLLALSLFAMLIFGAVRWLPLMGFEDKPVIEKNVVLNYSGLSELERSGIPNTRINVVSISAERERSFVMLGEKMYREGDVVAEGIKLSVIQKDYIVFDKQGVLIQRDLE